MCAAWASNESRNTGGDLRVKQLVLYIPLGLAAALFSPRGVHFENEGRGQLAAPTHPGLINAKWLIKYCHPDARYVYTEGGHATLVQGAPVIRAQHGLSVTELPCDSARFSQALDAALLRGNVIKSYLSLFTMPRSLKLPLMLRLIVPTPDGMTRTGMHEYVLSSHPCNVACIVDKVQIAEELREEDHADLFEWLFDPGTLSRAQVFQDPPKQVSHILRDWLQAGRPDDGLSEVTAKAYIEPPDHRSGGTKRQCVRGAPVPAAKEISRQVRLAPNSLNPARTVLAKSKRTITANAGRQTTEHRGHSRSPTPAASSWHTPPAPQASEAVLEPAHRWEYERTWGETGWTDWQWQQDQAWEWSRADWYQ